MFRMKFFENNLAIAIKKSELKQKLLNKHLRSEGHQAIEIQSVTLIDQVKSLDAKGKRTRKRKRKKRGL